MAKLERLVGRRSETNWQQRVVYIGTRPNELAKGFPTGDLLKHFINVSWNAICIRHLGLVLYLTWGSVVAAAAAST